MKEHIISLSESILNFIKGLPLTNLLVGVVVPITAAWISYYLAERAIRKKENNRLYVQIELIRKELQINAEELSNFIVSVEEKDKIENAMKFPLVFMKSFLINMLDGLLEIKQKYMYSGDFLFDKPIQAYILAQKLKDLGNEIEELECKYYDNEYLEEKRKEKLSNLIELKEQHIETLKELKDKDIYNEFKGLESGLERLMVDKIFEKLDERDNNFILAKYIYNKIKTFNEKAVKTKEDVLCLYKDLVIFEIDSDIVKDGYFDQENFDLYYKAFKSPVGIQKNMYDLCEQYYKLIALKEKIKNYCFDFESKRWNENSSDFVLINDRELYISLVEYYEELNKYIEQKDSCEEKYKYCVTLHDEIQNIMSKLSQNELKLAKKCK